MLKRNVSRFVWVSALLTFLFTLLGCAPEYVMIASPSAFQTAEQLEAQTNRESIPPDLKKRLRRVVAESQEEAANATLNKQYVGQTIPHPHLIMERKLVEELLSWAKEKPTQERLVLQKRRATFEGIVNESNDPDVRAEKSWRDHPKVQYGAGVVAGAAIGTVPFGPYAADVAIELHALPGGTYQARVGKACGEVISGVIQMALGCSGMTGGAVVTGTGAGAPAGIVVISASFALAANGSATTLHGVQEGYRLWKEGPPPDAPAPAPQEQLLKPKTAPQQPATAPPAQAAPAKPVQPAKPAAIQTKTVTRDKKTGKVVKPQETTAKPKQAQTQAGADVKPKGAKRGPKTDPDAPHNAAIKREVEKLRAQGNKVLAGGENPEKVVKTTGGLKDSRRPDIIYITPDGQRRGRNVGKTKADGTPVKREQEALDDLNKYSDTPTDFVSYDR